MTLVTEESREPLPSGLLANDAIAIFTFQHAVQLAVNMIHANRCGEIRPTESTYSDCRREVVEQFWKLADSELWPQPA